MIKVLQNIRTITNTLRWVPAFSFARRKHQNELITAKKYLKKREDNIQKYAKYFKKNQEDSIFKKFNLRLKSQQSKRYQKSKETEKEVQSFRQQIKKMKEQLQKANNMEEFMKKYSGDYSKEYQKKIRKMEEYFKRTNQKEEPIKNQKSSKKKEDEQQQQNPPKVANWKIFFSMVLFYVLFFSGDYDESTNFDPRFKGRLIPEDQMLRMLSTGGFQPDLIINRQNLVTGMLNNYYQTICVAKKVGTNQTFTCKITSVKIFLDSLQKIPTNFKVSFFYNIPPQNNPGNKFLFDLIFYGGLLLLAVYAYRKFFSSGIMTSVSDELGLKKFQAIKPENINTMFKDVAGMHQAKSQITEFVDFLKNPDKYIEMGAKIPKGALLTGPPGTGKTLLARACAGQAGVPFFYVSGSEFVEKYVGLGANRVRSLFESAAKSAPSIIFIDQIDAIGKKRDSGPFSNEEKDNTLNQLLVNMDGFESKNKIIVMAATNLKDSLDPALLRPGRFDRSIQITLPNFEERIEILKVHLLKVKFDPKFEIGELAKKVSILTPGFSGAELANICNQAAILAARQNKQFINLENFEKATERVMAGLEKRNLFSQQEKILLAYYECGKAIVSWFSENADPVIKISIAPFSKSSKGYSHSIKDEIPLRTKEELLTRVCCYLAGRAAEKHFKGLITTNGEEDLGKAKRIINYIVTKFGMSQSLQMIAFPDIEYVRKPYSEDTEATIDRQIQKITHQCQERVERMIIERAEMIEKLKVLILEKQTLTHHEIKDILGPRPFQDNENYNKYLKEEALEDKKVKQEGQVISGGGAA